MTKENSLMVYLKKQMEEYQQECESSKTLYADLLEHIEDCRDQIRQQRQMQDPGFAILSPLAGEEEEDREIARLEEQIAGYEKQKQKYAQEIGFYEEKLSEMQEQLDRFAENEAKNQAWKKKLEKENAELVAAAKAAEAEEIKEEIKGREGADQEKSLYRLKDADADKKNMNEKAQDCGLALKEENAYAYILKKLTEIKGYAQMDPRRCKMELERLTEYVRGQMAKRQETDGEC